VVSSSPGKQGCVMRIAVTGRRAWVLFGLFVRRVSSCRDMNGYKVAAGRAGADGVLMVID